MSMELCDIRKLKYEIHNYSSFSTTYLPEHIREDCPSNQTSRWSSSSNNPPQYLTVKLLRPAIVHNIKFGKYEKTHVCNLRKFKVFGGLEEEHLVLLFEGGLRNDSTPEVFNLRHKTELNEPLPILFLQIVPLLSWGPSFNFSIWYVELLGQDDPDYVRTSLRNYNMLREVEIVRLCLKHFRQQGYDTAFKALQEQTNVKLESQKMSDLHEVLVQRGDFNGTEKFVGECINEGLMDGYILRQDYKANWTLQDTSTSSINPGMRGGHQLIMDTDNNVIYLFGGWDGFEDLSDLWCYDITKNVWQLIHKQAELIGGPTPRSCHKMIYDPCNSQIFTLGRYLDGSSRTGELVKSDFYLYDTANKTWLQICDDTSQVGGPKLIFDHQMCMDVAKRTIYVFGGRILTPRNIEDLSNESYYSGLYSYHIATNTWTQLLVDCGHPTAADPDVLSIKSRVTHSMLFHTRHRKLYIFGGQRNKEYTTDFISYDVDTSKVEVLHTFSNALDPKNMPQSGFAQRATIDCDLDEIYVLSSLSKEKERRDLNLNSFWMYSLRTNVWTCISRNDHSSENCYSKTQSTCTEPCPRYAHQLVYNPANRAHYLFGGNPGKNTVPHVRLDDFWVLFLKKPNREQIFQQCKYLIRRLEYEEITKVNSLYAIGYLQTKLSEVVDHNDPQQLSEFHKLASLLFKSEDQTASLLALPLSAGMPSKKLAASSIDMDMDDSGLSSSADSTAVQSTSSASNDFKADMKHAILSSTPDERAMVVKNKRCVLYNKLVDLMPESLVQPHGNLSDFVLI